MGPVHTQLYEDAKRREHARREARILDPMATGLSLVSVESYERTFSHEAAEPAAAKSLRAYDPEDCWMIWRSCLNVLSSLFALVAADAPVHRTLGAEACCEGS